MIQRFIDWWANLWIPKWEIVDNGDYRMSSVRILSGDFKGMVFRYGKVSFSDEADTLSWVYEIEEYDPNKGIDEDRLRTIQGDILRQILAKDLHNDAFLIG